MRTPMRARIFRARGIMPAMRLCSAFLVSAAVIICAGVVMGSAHGRSAPPSRASGTFDVTLTSEEEEKGEGGTLGRSRIDKRFQGDLEGTSRGQMLSAVSAVKGSAGYVAIERVTGTLHGRRGTFVLQHTGTMTRGAPALTVSVVPDSSTGDLVGLTGTMTIRIVEGRHLYEFEYALPPRQ